MGIWIHSPDVIDKQIAIRKAQDVSGGFWYKLEAFWLAHKTQILQISLEVVSALVAIILKNPAILGIRTALTPDQQVLLDSLGTILKQGDRVQVASFNSIINA